MILIIFIFSKLFRDFILLVHGRVRSFPDSLSGISMTRQLVHRTVNIDAQYILKWCLLLLCVHQVLSGGLEDDLHFDFKWNGDLLSLTDVKLCPLCYITKSV